MKHFIQNTSLSQDAALTDLDYILGFNGLTLLYTRGFEIAILHVMVHQPCRFSPCLHRYGNLTIPECTSTWVNVMLPYREGVEFPVVGGGVV